MNCRLAPASLLILAFWVNRVTAIDPYYHTNQEIYDHIVAWQEIYPDTVRVDTIGYSHQDHLPIWAVKLSDNVGEDEDEPTVLLVGQVHAEEILGVEVVLALMDTILTKRLQELYRVWLQTLEIWLIPTANPEGHQVVMDEWDIAYRKNKHDLNNNGIFDYQPGMGGDLDGVDINRNFPLNWVHGDTFMQPGGAEAYDYFKGFSPLSETETQGLWNLGQREKFSFSVIWHSSRSGANAERVFYPWDWDDSGKTPPDFNVLESTAVNVASRIPRLGTGTYNYFPSDAPRGNQHDNFYASFGTIALLIECGTENLQPPAAQAQQIVAANLQGAAWLLNRAAGYGNNPNPNHAQITGVVKDAGGNPLPAVVSIAELDGPYLQPRTCDTLYGRYRRYVMPGTYTLRVHLRGYESQETVVTANSSGKITRNFTLTAKPVYTLSGEVRALGGTTLPAALFIRGEDVDDTVFVASDGQVHLALPSGGYSLLFDSPGCVPRFDYIPLDQDRYVVFELAPETVVFSDAFEAGLNLWNHGGTNDRWGTEADTAWGGGAVATESPYAEYSSGTDSWLRIATPLDLTGYVTAALVFDHWYYFEPGYDYAVVEASANGGSDWDAIIGPFDRQNIGWGKAYGDLNPYCGMPDVRLRWRVWTDGSLNEQGWRLDNIRVTAADTADSAPPDAQMPTEHGLISVYPNPFNSNFNLLLHLQHPEWVKIALWDVGGRMAAEVAAGELSAGSHRFNIALPPTWGAGIYLLRIQRREKTEIRKILYLK